MLIYLCCYYIWVPSCGRCAVPRSLAETVFFFFTS